MEEYEKRKERLKALRMEAAQAEVSTNVETSAMPGRLSNPLRETSSAPTANDDFREPQRFGYYTDPMAAFSANRRRANVDNQSTQRYSTPPMAKVSSSHPRPRNFDVNPPVHDMQSEYSLDNRMCQQQGPYNNFAAHQSPIIRGPVHMHHADSNAWNGSQASPVYYSPASDGSPRGMFGGSTMHPGTSPRTWNPSNASGYGDSPRPGLLSADALYGRGQPQNFWNNPFPGQGGNPGAVRGRGRGYGGSFSNRTVRGGGRGWGSHGRSSPSNRTFYPMHFFNESMLEDPWEHLKPVLWKREAGKDSTSAPKSDSWLPDSIRKKPKVSETSNKFNSQTSLAEFLAASFNKAVEDTVNE